MSFITTKLLGYVSGGLSIALLLSGTALGLQTHRLGTAQDKIVTLNQTVKAEAKATDAATLAANQRALDLTARDGIIATQSQALDSLSAAAKRNRDVYTANLAHANVGAQANESRAAALIAMPSPAETDRCEAARALIEEELTSVH